jgi:heat shock protein HslJ
VLPALPPAAPASAADNPLAGTKWRVAWVEGKIVNRSAHERLAFRSRHERLAFRSRHHFTAHGTCGNDFGGRYRATATRLRFSDVVTTGVGCEGAEPVPDIAGVVDRTRRYRITGRKLELLGHRGRTLAVLRRRR